MIDVVYDLLLGLGYLHKALAFWTLRHSRSIRRLRRRVWDGRVKRRSDKEPTEAITLPRGPPKRIATALTALPILTQLDCAQLTRQFSSDTFVDPRSKQPIGNPSPPSPPSHIHHHFDTADLGLGGDTLRRSNSELYFKTQPLESTLGAKVVDVEPKPTSSTRSLPT